MAATWTGNVTLSAENEYSSFIDYCKTVGAYVIIVKCEVPEGSHAVFHVASSNDGQHKVNRTVWVAGSNGEQVHVEWPEDCSPILCYLNDESAPEEERHYNLKIL